MLKAALPLNNAFRVDVKSTRGEVGGGNAISAVAANLCKMKVVMDLPKCIVMIATIFAGELASLL